MDQNEQKSVWLKLILPICFGIFAAAIYQNAIKTKETVTVWVAQKSIEQSTDITRENLAAFFEEQPIFLHKETPPQVKDSFAQPEDMFNDGGTQAIAIKRFEQGDFAFKGDFK